MLYTVTPVIDRTVRNLCQRPYHGHPNGCPNYNHVPRCPPYVPIFDTIFDVQYPVFAIVNKFDFRAHVERMRELHPTWSKYQLECCLYWQQGARNRLKGMIKEFQENFMMTGYSVVTTPEAMGVDVTKTMATVGVVLEWPPVNFTYQVALAAWRKDNK